MERLSVEAGTGTRAMAAPQTVPALLAHRATTDAGRIALVANDGTGKYREWTYSALDAVVSSFADLLSRQMRSAGILPRGAQVVWAYDNSSGALALLLYYAVLRAGAVNVPMNPSQTRAETRLLSTRLSNPFVVAPSSEMADGLDETAPRLIVSCVGELEQVLQGAAGPASGCAAPRAESPSVVLFTSGTTGRSKGVVHTHASAMAAGRGWRHAFELTPQDVYQSTFPIFSGAGLHFNAVACLVAGCTFIIDEPKPTSASLHRVSHRCSTVYAAVPAIYEFWLTELADAKYDLASLRLLDFGGAVMRRETIKALRLALPEVELVQTYGLTEAGPGGLYLPGGLAEEHLGSIGVIATGDLELKVDTTVTGGHHGEAELVGELLVAGSSVMAGYLGDQEATDSVFQDGWLRTGDLVRRDASGTFHLLDRIKDLILRGGQNISTIELEDVFLQFPGVREAAAFGLPHERLGESVAAAIVPAELSAFDVDGFKAFVERVVSRHKVPSHFLLVPSLPYSAAGKVLKHSLRASDGMQLW